MTLPTLTVGDNYTFSVAATNQLGTGMAQTSNSVAILPTASQLSASLSALLAPSGSRGRLRATRRARGYTFSWNSLEAGQLTLTWYGHYTTGHGKHRRQHRTVIAKAAERVSTGPIKLVVRLTATGRRLLKRARQVRVTSQLKFTGAGLKQIRKSRTFHLH